MRTDIVAQLRVWAENAKEQGVADVVHGLQSAADEIERLRAERDEARREIRLLMADRDAARREVCEARAACIQGKKATEIADALGWSCFDPVDTRGLHGDPREIHVEGHFHMNSWVDGPRRSP